jgi:hypothetical protein
MKLGKTSTQKNLEKNDKLRQFPKLGDPLDETQQARLSEMLGVNILPESNESAQINV